MVTYKHKRSLRSLPPRGCAVPCVSSSSSLEDSSEGGGNRVLCTSHLGKVGEGCKRKGSRAAEASRKSYTHSLNPKNKRRMKSHVLAPPVEERVSSTAAVKTKRGWWGGVGRGGHWHHSLARTQLKMECGL